MSRQQLRADFFVTCDGIAIIKAKPLTTSEKQNVYRSGNMICKYCGKKLKLFRNQISIFSEYKHAAVDHIIPRSRGGQNDQHNLQLLCVTCNSQKGAMV